MAAANASTLDYLTSQQLEMGFKQLRLTFHETLIEDYFKMQITGPSLSGKSTFILHLIRHREVVFQTDFKRIVYCYPEDERAAETNAYIQTLKEAFPRLEVMKGLPNLNILRTGEHTLVSLLINYSSSFSSFSFSSSCS